MKFKKVAITVLATAMLVSALSISASAASTSVTLSRNSTSATSSAIGLYKSGYAYLSNSSSSNDGVNMYLDQSEPGYGWANARHIFAQPGASATSSTASYSNGRNWRGVLNSWWVLGSNNYAAGTVTAN